MKTQKRMTDVKHTAALSAMRAAAVPATAAAGQGAMKGAWRRQASKRRIERGGIAQQHRARFSVPDNRQREQA